MCTAHKKIRRYQCGAETVEFMVTLLLFFFVFFMIVDFAIATYNRGVMINAAREGSRQGSLFWVDPALFDPTTPAENQRLKRAMVDTVMTWTETNLLIDPGDVGLDLVLQIDGADVDEAATSVSVDPSMAISVDLSYAHQYLGLHAFVMSTEPTMTTLAGAGVE